MADRIKGITIEIGGDTTGLNKALGGVNKEIRNTQSQLKDVERLLKLDPSNTELLSQKQKLLTQAISDTANKLETLKTAEQQAQQQFAEGKINQQQYDALKREIIETEKQLDSLKESAKNANVTLQQISLAGDKLQEFGGKISGVGEKLLPVTGAIAGIGAAGIAAALELDDGYDTIITKTGATGEALEGLNKVADDIFSNLPTSMENAGTAVGEVNTRFGATGDVLEDLSTKFIQFAEINGVDLNNSIGTVDKIMEQWNIDMSETGDVLGIITKKGQDTGISVDALMDSVQKNGATFKEMGLNLAQSIDLMAQFEANGVNAETAIAGLKKSIKNYTSEGKSTEEALKLTIGSIKEAKTETEALAIAQNIFGAKGAAEMSKAIREGRIDLNDLSSSMSEYGTVVEDTFNATLDPWDDAKVAMNNLKLAGADLGSTLLSTLQPTITAVVNKVKELTKWFEGLSDSQKENIVKILAIVAAIGPLLIIIGKVVAGVGTLIKVFGTVSSLFSASSAALGAGGAAATGFGSAITALAGPIAIIIAAIAAFIAIFVTLYKNNEDFRNKVQEVWSQIQEIIGGIIENIKGIISGFIAIASALWQQYGDDMTIIISNAFSYISDFIKTAITLIRDILSVVLAVIKGDWSGAWEAMKTLVSNLFDGIKNIVSSGIDLIKSIIKLGTDITKDIFEAFKDKVIEIFYNLQGKLSEKITEIKETIINGIGAAVDWIKALPGQAIEWGKDFIDGFVSGIKEKIGDVTDAIKGVAEKITAYIHFSRPDIGPLREYEKWMPDMITGMAKGIKDNAWKITDQLRGLTGSMSYMINGESGSYSADLSKIEGLLGYYLPGMTGGSNIVLDDGALVGKMLPNIDSGLTNFKDTKGRNG
ncbi:phage tail tape measure protein [Lacrimispora saccharolytica]|uniref:Phage tail tape measure protein, TP901 family n=1 Tax=Lacrimispora saccharolytica (strain ATCC 35040 / DSM 2544 / NRCC 2533 / WM1) TaxID=610130 RepID=D9R5H1_LACSW|nr:phage tail tape measure protein [Lacrimispora saccharolytica]ADL03377.1 phage tail tape measure protein, TP901 family [[Clostridium] saccharolyticum WM1]QRV18466.1 phage tail tape measure protein [Lacrimispora saccharolytica]